MIVTNQFVAEGLSNWVGTSMDLKKVVEGNQKVGMIFCRLNMEFYFRILAVSRNIGKKSERVHEIQEIG